MDQPSLDRLVKTLEDLLGQLEPMIAAGATHLVPVRDKVAELVTHFKTAGPTIDWKLVGGLIETGLTAAAAADTDPTSKAILSLIAWTLGKFLPPAAGA